MPVPPIMITEREGAAPLAGPMVSFDRTRLGIAMGIPGLGWVEIERDGVVVTGPSPENVRAVRDRTLQWARAVWLAAKGFRVIPGTAVAKDGAAVAFVGASRTAKTITALLLAREEWSMVSDGMIVFDSGGFLLGDEEPALVDTFVAQNLLPDVRQQVASCGRDRSKLWPTARCADASLWRYCNMAVLHSLTELAVTVFADGGEWRPSEDVDQSIGYGLFGSPPDLDRCPVAPRISVGRPVRLGPDAFDCRPTVVASQLVDLLDSQ